MNIFETVDGLEIEKLKSLIIDYERALSVLVNSSPGWAINVSNSDAAGINELLKLGE